MKTLIIKKRILIIIFMSINVLASAQNNVDGDNSISMSVLTYLLKIIGLILIPIISAFIYKSMKRSSQVNEYYYSSSPTDKQIDTIKKNQEAKGTKVSDPYSELISEIGIGTYKRMRQFTIHMINDKKDKEEIKIELIKFGLSEKNTNLLLQLLGL